MTTKLSIKLMTSGIPRLHHSSKKFVHVSKPICCFPSFAISIHEMMMISIPQVIDDYFVELAHKLIAYYRTDVRCWRTWMSLMFHMLDCMRVNSYVACKNMGYQGTHKEFTMEWCEALFARAKAEDVRETRKRRSNANDREASPTDSIGSSKKRRMSHTRPELPHHILQGHKDDQ